MRHRGAVRGWKTLSRFALIGVIGGGAAACSTDASRLSEPFSNPFSSLVGEPAATGSLAAGDEAAQTAAPAIRTPRVQSQELAAPSPGMSPRPPATAALSPPVTGAVSGMNPSGMNPSGANPDADRPAKAQAMTPRVTPAAPQPKLQLSQGPKTTEKKLDKAAEKAAEKKAAEEAKAAEARKVAEKKAEETKKAADAKKAAETKKVAEAKPKHDVKDAKDAKKAEAAKKAESEAKAARAEASKEAAKKVAEAKAAEAAAKASVKETKVAAKEAPAPVPSKPAAPEPTNTGSVASASNESFRWPAKGRVINGYGSSGNEGINIAVPEGTPVKAAEDGTVAYAGSDVKGYGKLVLVRHTNGYVSAYAHNGELDVRPGEKVKRGQTIAKSGATGNVTSPQLHFEIRKGATPVDPIPHLASN